MIRTNHKPRPIEYDDHGNANFRYKGECYSLSEFGRINNDPTDPHSIKADESHPWVGWDGFQMDPGGWTIPPLLIKIVDDGDSVIVGRPENV